jgi:hypothetical protein
MVRALILAASVASALTLSPQAPPARLDARAAIPYFIESGTRVRGYLDSDAELATFAFDAWSRESDGVLRFVKTGSPASATIRIRWISAGDGLYGETQRVSVDGKPGAIVNVMPEVSMQGEPLASFARTDGLLRDTVVYLTCVHEIGHALGLQHSRDFADIMYFFSYGGDVVQYFERYRKTLRARADIKTSSGISAGDRALISQLYPKS